MDNDYNEIEEFNDNLEDLMSALDGTENIEDLIEMELHRGENWNG